MLRTLLEQNMVRPIQNALSGLLSGALSGMRAGGNWFSDLTSLIGGGRGLTATGSMAASDAIDPAAAGSMASLAQAR